MELKKEEISTVLLRLWYSLDQAGYQDDVDKAFKNIPVKLQKEFIKNWVEGDDWDTEPDEEVLEEAKKICGIE